MSMPGIITQLQRQMKTVAIPLKRCERPLGGLQIHGFCLSSGNPDQLGRSEHPYTTH